ncbi:MAG: RNA pyrophosphohydrolase [Alphaproteobacteria bacterium]|nr:RNA pyrophosphohydrolase [Alphaproteobacteria bacterium]
MILSKNFHVSSKDHLYRPNVGIILINTDKKIFVGRRCDSLRDDKVPAWQMPQGGIDDGESIEEAALRELLEEIGTNHVEVIKVSDDWYYYDLPKALAQKLWGGKYLGQRQKWVLAHFKGTDVDINLNTYHPEFCAFQWVAPRDAIHLIVDFKKDLYTQVLSDFTVYLV